MGHYVDEKSQIQALDRTRKSLPLYPGRLGTMTHDDKRHGTTTQFAALDVAKGIVIEACMSRHRHREWIQFPESRPRATPGGTLVPRSDAEAAQTGHVPLGA